MTAIPTVASAVRDASVYVARSIARQPAPARTAAALASTVAAHRACGAMPTSVAVVWPQRIHAANRSREDLPGGQPLPQERALTLAGGADLRLGRVPASHRDEPRRATVSRDQPSDKGQDNDYPERTRPSPRRPFQPAGLGTQLI
jgi:hypothetical protein